MYRIDSIESAEFIATPTLLLSRIKPLEPIELKESRVGVAWNTLPTKKHQYIPTESNPQHQVSTSNARTEHHFDLVVLQFDNEIVTEHLILEWRVANIPKDPSISTYFYSRPSPIRRASTKPLCSKKAGGYNSIGPLYPNPPLKWFSGMFLGQVRPTFYHHVRQTSESF